VKKLITIFMIGVLFVQSSSQVWLLASFLFNRNYIAENLCINRFDLIPVCKGSCVLEEQIEKSKKDQEKQPELKLNPASPYQISPALETNFEQLLSVEEPITRISDICFTTSTPLSSIFHPPKIQETV
jgi:hypothetical protein